MREMAWQFLVDYKDWMMILYLAIIAVAGVTASVNESSRSFEVGGDRHGN